MLHLEVGETRAAMLSDGPDGLTLVIADRDGDAQPFGLDLGALRLGAWRHVTAMRLVEDALLAAVADPTAGFDLFCFDLTAKQSAPTLLMTRGAHRFAVNAAVSAIRSSPYGILIGTAALAGPTQSFGSWGPELLLVTPDRDWDLLVGQPRFSPDGLKVPVSNLAPGFGDPQNAAIKAICHQELKGKPTAVIAMQAFSAAPEDDRRKAASDLFHYAGALRLFRSEDLRQWDEAPHDLGPDIGSVTDICMTASGLLVGHERLGRDQPPVSFVPLD